MALAQAWMSDPAPASPDGGGGGGWEKRRIVSDAHFNRVAGGVSDVAAKLERVVDAMGRVEVESRGIWGGIEGEERGGKGREGFRPSDCGRF